MRIQDLFAKKRLLFLSAALFAFQLNAKAEDDAPPALQWHGYGNIANSRIYAEQDGASTVGYGDINKRGTFLYNSILGLNMSYAFNDQVTFYGQLTALGSIVASGFNTQSYPVRVDMAFLSYRPFDWLDVRIGRQVMPTWMLSEQIDVSATYPWIRPPSDVYNLAPMKSANGVGLDVSHNFADVYDVKAGVRLGEATYVDDSAYSSANLTNIIITYVEAKYNNMLSLRASWGNTDALASTVATGMVKRAQWMGAYDDGTDASKRVIIGPLSAARDSTLVSLPTGYAGKANWNTEFTFYSFGGKLEYKDLLLMGEYAATNQNLRSIVAADSKSIALVPTGVLQYRSWYGTAAYHFGDWTPHLTYSQVERNLMSANYGKITAFNYNMDNTSTADGLGGSVNNNYNSSFGGAFKDSLRAGLESSAKIKTVTLGLNYNFTPTLIGKVQIEQVRTGIDGDIPKAGAGATTLNTIANTLANNKANPFSPVRPGSMNLLNGQQVSSNDIMTIGEVAVAFVF